LALYLAIAFYAFAGGLWSPHFLLGGVIVLVGFLDDCRHLPWQFRLLVQAAVSLAAVASSLPTASWVLWIVGALWIVVLINAMNFVDNMDGACAGIAWIIAASLAMLRMGVPNSAYEESGAKPAEFAPTALLGFIHLILLMGALAGFLWYNRSPARVFMGDAGSTFIGFFLGVASVPLLFGNDWLTPVCMFALPIYDFASVAALRLWQKRGLFVSDKNNLSHRLVELGFKPTRAVALLWLLALVGGVGGLLLVLAPNPAKTILGVAQLGGWWIGLPVVEYFARRTMKR
jgi:UDP-GlcNAc:undecaprenyl-phosphate GlcNAc-1-phosphate transferase